MKSKKDRKKALRKAIKFRTEITLQRNEIDNSLKEINQFIIKVMKRLKLDSYTNNGQLTRVMQNNRDIWDEEGLYKLILKKVGKKTAKEAVVETIVKKVDDDVVLRLIQEKKLTIKQVNQYIEVKPGAPFVRVFD